MGQACSKDGVAPTAGADPVTAAPAATTTPAAAAPAPAAAPAAVKTAPQVTEVATPPRDEVKTWSVARVSQLLRELGLPADAVEAVAANDVDGALLLTLSEQDLGEAGVEGALQRKKVMGWLSKLATSVVPAAAANPDDEDDQVPAGRATVIASFVSDAVVSRFLANPSALEKPESHALSGAIFFADLAGFTALCESMAHERVSAHLSRIFGEMANAINDHGGDVMKFAGDAVIAMFGDAHGHDGPSAERQLTANLKALKCALYFAENLNIHEADDVTLTMHLGVVGGTLSGLHVGGHHGEWEFLVTGRPFQDLDACVSASAHGEVVTSPDVWRTVVAHATGQPMDCGMYHVTALRDTIAASNAPVRAALLHADPQLVELVEHYVPTIVRAKAAAGSVGWIGELRTVSILFVAIGGLKLSFGADGQMRETDLLQKAIYVMQSATLNNGGFIRQFAVDDKGTVLVAGWGVAPCAYEDDAVRAISTALEIATKLDAIGLKANCGVSTGEVYCGTVGSSKRQEYCMVGDKVNLSARLMKASGGGVLCCQQTFESASRATAITFLDPAPAPIRVKGKRDLVVIARPLVAKHSDGKHPRRRRSKISSDALPHGADVPEPVGRHEIVAKLHGVLEALTLGNGGVVEIRGASGSGKSHMLQYVEQLATGRGLRCLGGASPTLGQGAAYSMWRGVFIKLFGLEDLPEEAQAGHVLARLLELSDGDEQWMLTAHLLGQVIGIEMAPDANSPALPRIARAGLTSALILFVLTATAASAPLVILLDNVELGDSLSIDLVSAVGAIPNLLLVFTNDPTVAPRSAAAMAIVERLAGNASIQHIDLEPLDRAAMGELLAAELSSDALPDAVLDAAMAQSGGNALYAQYIVAAMRDQGIFAVRAGRCELLGDVSTAGIPDALQALITARLSQLDEVDRLLLKVASILPEAFTTDLLVAVFPITATQEQVLEALVRLVDGRLLVRLSTERFSLPDAVTRSAVNGLLLTAQKKELCERVLNHLSAPSSFDEYGTMLAEFGWRYELGAMGIDIDNLDNLPPDDDIDVAKVEAAARSLMLVAERDLQGQALDGWEKADMALAIVHRVLQDDGALLLESLHQTLPGLSMAGFATRKIPLGPDFVLPKSGFGFFEAIDLMVDTAQRLEAWDALGGAVTQVYMKAVFTGAQAQHPGPDFTKIQYAPASQRVVDLADQLIEVVKADPSKLSNGVLSAFHAGWLMCGCHGDAKGMSKYLEAGNMATQANHELVNGKYVTCSAGACKTTMGALVSYLAGSDPMEVRAGIAASRAQDNNGKVLGQHFNVAFKARRIMNIALFSGDTELLNECLQQITAPHQPELGFGDVMGAFDMCSIAGLGAFLGAKAGKSGDELAEARGTVLMVCGMMPMMHQELMLVVAASCLVSEDYAWGYENVAKFLGCAPTMGPEYRRIYAELAVRAHPDSEEKLEEAREQLRIARALAVSQGAAALGLRVAITQARLMADCGAKDFGAAAAWLQAAITELQVHPEHPDALRAARMLEGLQATPGRTVGDHLY